MRSIDGLMTAGPHGSFYGFDHMSADFFLVGRKAVEAIITAGRPLSGRWQKDYPFLSSMIVYPEPIYFPRLFSVQGWPSQLRLFQIGPVKSNTIILDFLLSTLFDT